MLVVRHTSVASVDASLSLPTLVVLAQLTTLSTPKHKTCLRGCSKPRQRVWVSKVCFPSHEKATCLPYTAQDQSPTPTQLDPPLDLAPEWPLLDSPLAFSLDPDTFSLLCKDRAYPQSGEFPRPARPAYFQARLRELEAEEKAADESREIDAAATVFSFEDPVLWLPWDS